MKHLIVTLAAAGLALAAGATEQGSLSGTVYTITVAKGDTVTLNGEDVTALGADNTLLKMGLGRLIINLNLGATYDGEIIVREGFLRATSGGTGSTRGLGGTTKGTIVEKDATLEMVGVSGQNECANGEPLTFVGSGVDGCGAVYCCQGGNSGYGIFAGSTITMTGDATVGAKTGTGWFRIRNTAINMQGHDLTFQNSDANNGFKGGQSNVGPVTNPGNIIVAESASFRLENSDAKITKGSASNKFILKAGSVLSLADKVGGRCGWTIQVDGAATFQRVSSASSYGLYGWSGPIVLNDTLTIQSDCTSASYPLTFDGAISGTGALVYAGTGTTVMNGDATRTHSYTGGTTFNANCNVKLAAPGLVPATAGAITATAGAKVLVTPSAASDYTFFTDEAVTVLQRALTAGVDRTAEVYITGSGTSWPDGFVDTLAVSGTSASPTVYSGFVTNAETRLTGAMSGFVNVSVRPLTTVRLAADGLTESWTEVNGGTLVIPAGVTLTASNFVYVGGADATHVGRLKVEGTLNFNSVTAGNRGVSASSQATASNIRTTERGIVEIAKGARVTGTIGLNQGASDRQKSTASGSYFVKGTVVAAAEAFIGDFRNEYLEIADGAIVSNKSTRVGRGWAASYGHLRVTTNGFLHCDDVSNLYLSYNGGNADCLVDGGRISAPNCALYLNHVEAAHSSYVTGAYASLTVCDGGEARFPAPGGYGWSGNVINSCKSSCTYVNLAGGGLLEANSFFRNTGLEGNRVIISFDGGIYAMRYNTQAQYQNKNCFAGFRAGEGTAGDHVFVFANGAVISNATPTSVGFTMEAPTGKGIESIALPDAIANRAAWELVGAPMVRITDETGYGATAVAIYDSTSGKVTSIRVTSRGVNYTNPTITFSKGGLTASEKYTGCCTLTDNVSGGLTKLGTDTLFVTNAMAYTGATTVKQGTLKLGLDNALDSSSGIVVGSGATLDLNGKACAVGVSGYGSVKGSVTLPTDWTIDGAELAAATTSFAATGTVTIPSGATLTITHPEQLNVDTKYVVAQAGGTLVGDVPTLVCPSGRPWRLAKRGNRLVLMAQHGLHLILK